VPDAEPTDRPHRLPVAGAHAAFRAPAAHRQQHRQRRHPGLPGTRLRFRQRAAPGGAAAGSGAAGELGSPIARGASGLASAPSAASPELNYAAAAQTNLDSNTVDMDRERASFADNAARYEATLRFINGSLRTLQDAMKSPSAG
jgi:hypothetical protein